MFRPVRWLLVMSLLLLPALLAAASGAGSRTMDYAWLLFLKVNEPPQIINVWADQDEIAWPDNSVLLNATVIDDPRDTLTYEWTELDGVAFSNRFVKEPTATFTPYGTFHLQLTVTDDGGLTSTATVTVIFNNSAPQVNAGSDKQITHPTNSVNLDATVTDNPSDTLTYKWTQFSGPGTAVFANSSAVDTQVTLSKVGTYVLQLRADDGELANTDTVMVEYIAGSVDKIRVMRAVGDSWTEGIGDGDGTGSSSCKYDSSGKYIENTCEGFPPKLRDFLNNAGRYADGLKIMENGYGGRTTAEAIIGSTDRPSVKTIVNKKTDFNGDSIFADMVVVLLGTNDACGSSAPDGDEFESNMKRIIKEIKNVGAEPVLVKVPYARKDGPPTCYSNSKIRGYNLRIQKLADNDASIKVTPPDLYTWFENHQSEIWGMRRGKVDYVHPTRDGYWSVARKLRDKLLQ